MGAGSQGWIGVDLDGTLAEYHGWRGIEYIGKPIPRMVKRVKRWLAEGKHVKIFTARVCRTGKEGELAREFVEEWSKRHLGIVLEVTNVKDFGLLELWDDRAVQVQINEGEPVAGTRSEYLQISDDPGD